MRMVGHRGHASEREDERGAKSHLTVPRSTVLAAAPAGGVALAVVPSCGGGSSSMADEALSHEGAVRALFKLTDPAAGPFPSDLFARGDQNAKNPGTFELLRAGGLADRTLHYRHDLAFDEDPGVPKNPHGFFLDSMNLNLTFRSVSRGAGPGRRLLRLRREHHHPSRAGPAVRGPGTAPPHGSSQLHHALARGGGRHAAK